MGEGSARFDSSLRQLGGRRKEKGKRRKTDKNDILQSSLSSNLRKLLK